MIHGLLGGDVGVDGLGVPELDNPCVLNRFDDEGTTAQFGGLVQLEIVSQQFVDGIGAGAEKRSGVDWDSWVYGWMCERRERLFVSRFVSSVGG